MTRSLAGPHGVHRAAAVLRFWGSLVPGWGFWCRIGDLRADPKPLNHKPRADRPVGLRVSSRGLRVLGTVPWP